MGDTAITEVEEVEVFDDDDKEEEKRQYFRELDYDSVVISKKIKVLKNLLKKKYDDLIKKKSALLYSHESCEKLFNRIDNPKNERAIGIMQHTEVANYLTELRHKKDINKIDYIDRIFLERVNLTEENIPTEEGDRQQILGKIRDEFKQLGFHIDDSSGIKGANLSEFIEFMNKDKKNHSKEISLLKEIIDIAQEKIKYEIVDCRLKGLKGAISILIANSLILKFFKKFLDNLQQDTTSQDIARIILDFDNLFLNELISLSKSKIYLEYQHVRFDSDTIETLYHEDKDVLIEILKKQAQELLDEIIHLKSSKSQDIDIKQLVQIQILATTLVAHAKVINNKYILLYALQINNSFIRILEQIIENNKYDMQDMQVIDSAEQTARQLKSKVEKHATFEQKKTAQMATEEDADEEDAKYADDEVYDMQEKIIEIDDHNLKKLEKILYILQDFIYTECIDNIKTSLADSIITLKLSSIQNKFELEGKIQKLIEDTKLERIACKATMFSRGATPLLYVGDPSTQPFKENDSLSTVSTVSTVKDAVKVEAHKQLTELLTIRANEAYKDLQPTLNEVTSTIKTQDHELTDDTSKAYVVIVAQEALKKAVYVLNNTIQYIQQYKIQNEESIIQDLYIKTRELTKKTLEHAKKALRDDMVQDDKDDQDERNEQDETAFNQITKKIEAVESAMDVDITDEAQELVDQVKILTLINTVENDAQKALEDAKNTLLENAKNQKIENQKEAINLLAIAISHANEVIQIQNDEINDEEFLGMKALGKVNIAKEALEKLNAAQNAVNSAELAHDQGAKEEKERTEILRNSTDKQTELTQLAINKAIEALYKAQQIAGDEDNVKNITMTIENLNGALVTPNNAGVVFEALENAKSKLNYIAQEQDNARIVVGQAAQQAPTVAHDIQSRPVNSLEDGIAQTNKALKLLEDVVHDINNTPFITVTQKIYLLITLLNLEIATLYKAETIAQTIIGHLQQKLTNDVQVGEALRILHNDVFIMQTTRVQLLGLNINTGQYSSEMQNPEALQYVLMIARNSLEPLNKIKGTLERLQKTPGWAGGKKQKKKKSKKGEILTFKF